MHATGIFKETLLINNKRLHVFKNYLARKFHRTEIILKLYNFK